MELFYIRVITNTTMKIATEIMIFLDYGNNNDYYYDGGNDDCYHSNI